VLLGAINWFRNLRLNCVTFELDFKQALNNFNNNAIDDSGFGDIIKECKSDFLSNFTNSHIKCKSVFHLISKHFIILLEWPYR
jgi:hypothetical protein